MKVYGIKKYLTLKKICIFYLIFYFQLIKLYFFTNKVEKSTHSIKTINFNKLIKLEPIVKFLLFISLII